LEKKGGVGKEGNPMGKDKIHVACCGINLRLCLGQGKWGEQMGREVSGKRGTEGGRS